MTPPKPLSPVDEFLQRLVNEHGQLSRQLKLIGAYIEQHRDHVGLERIQDIADHCGVQPSAVVRFAKHFGFSGFSEMQALFRAGIATQIAPSRSYPEPHPRSRGAQRPSSGQRRHRTGVRGRRGGRP